MCGNEIEDVEDERDKAELRCAEFSSENSSLKSEVARLREQLRDCPKDCIHYGNYPYNMCLSCKTFKWYENREGQIVEKEKHLQGEHKECPIELPSAKDQIRIIGDGT